MSVLGTGTAAAVAGTALTAQQKARQQANARNGEQFAARRQADAYVQGLHALRMRRAPPENYPTAGRRGTSDFSTVRVPTRTPRPAPVRDAADRPESVRSPRARRDRST